MKEKEKGDLNPPKQPEKNKAENNTPGYPEYPASDDIYSKFREEKNINPEDDSKLKESTEDDNDGTDNEKELNGDLPGSDLDIPGSELDDEQENIGNEDEENNYYSLGDDNEDNVEEDKDA
jgi:hypothetical protein